MPPWNAAGTGVSSGPVTDAGSVSVTGRAVPQRRDPPPANRQSARSRLPSMPLQCRQLPDPRRRRPLPQAVAPTAATRCRAAPARRLAARYRRPRRRQIRHQDAPRHPVHRKMMDRQQQQPVRCAPASNHTACNITPAAGASRSGPPRRRRDRACSRGVDPPASIRRSTLAATTVPGGAISRPQSPPAAQPRPSAAATHRDDPAAPAALPQMRLSQTRRHSQQHRLIEAINRPAALQQPAHDRRCGTTPTATRAAPRRLRIQRARTAASAATV